MHPLDLLSTRKDYTRLFTDARLWTPYVRQACAEQGIPCRQVTTGIPGTCPTFIVDRQVVVKFFGVLFNGERSFAVERSIAHLLAENPTIPSARLRGEGALNPEGASWHWPYLIFEFLEGNSYGEARRQLSFAEQIRLAAQFGGWVRSLHALPVPEDGTFERDWSGYTSFLASQTKGCASRHAAWGSLPDRLIDQVDGYLLPPGDLVDPHAQPHLIHADLTGDHLLGQVISHRWETRGLIDFGDARIGNIYYELPALHTDFFQGDRRLLGAFLKGYGFVPPPDFPRRALTFCLLHEFDLFVGSGYVAGLVQKCQTLADLAEQLWRI